MRINCGLVIAIAVDHNYAADISRRKQREGNIRCRRKHEKNYARHLDAMGTRMPGTCFPKNNQLSTSFDTSVI